MDVTTAAILCAAIPTVVVFAVELVTRCAIAIQKREGRETMLLIDKFSGKPVYEQLIEGIERGILMGAFAEGSQLPSLREMSAALSINPNTIQKSYAELTRRGVILPAPGSGCYVAPDAREVLRREALGKLEMLSELASELRLAGVGEEDILAAVQMPTENHENKEGL
ncbi:MAG: GntR family transcriptional regulator [Clostridia bacterium]|nr:GntR family transcriptional regulator [Clostridia bacterium]